ncbi:transcription factor MYB88 isoform X2 [Setaria italica]|uniref:transcription factor MYB88 isoform X2 n=1 Tax=Setaria italica TaxID=4555 RepID=UPI000BE50725|nr:transcription factor MYB88 isoform X2 [Setaria italica]
MATGPDLSSSSGAAAAAVPDAAPGAAAKKDRHIVSWSAEEDSVLRAQIALHGTDNWTIIAAQFKDKTARQCRRRWYNYLNSECKKGGWSREEDMLLCEAQKLLGNRWTEIAKVVSGRTDNAVKNRFSTLCKRRAKDDEPFQENGTPCSNTNAKRVLTQTGCVTPGAASSSAPMKQMSSDLKENIVPNMRLFGQEKGTHQDARQPLATLSSNNQQNVNTVKSHNLVTTTTKPLLGPEQHCVKQEGNFMNKDDPKVAILLQQADLLCSLATKIKTDDTSQSMDEAWQQLQHHLVKKDDNGMSENSESGIASLLEELDDLIVDPYESKEEDEQKIREQNGQRQTDVENEHCTGPSQASMEVTSNMVPDEMMEDHTVDNCKEVSNLCRNMLSRSMEACPDAKIPASENLSEVAEDSRLQRVESTSPGLTDFDDFIIDPYENTEEDEQNIREQNGQIDAHNNQSYGHSQATMELTPGMAPDELMEACPADSCKEDNSLCRNVLSGSMEPCPGEEKAASTNSSEVAEESRLQCIESTSPVLANFQTKECGETPAPEKPNEVVEDSRLQCVEFTSPSHTVLRAKAGAETFASPRIPVVAKDSKLPSMEFTSPAHTVLRTKAGAETFASPRSTVVAKDSKLPSMEFTSPAHTVATFQPYADYADDMPTPKFTASERNFLLSVIELTSPGSRPETSQQPSCKRALLNSL